MSCTDLSREIAQYVSRALGGEAIDSTTAGEALAARFPDLGMSGELIGKAIARATSMMGVVLEGAEAAIAPPVYASSNAAFWYLRAAAPDPMRQAAVDTTDADPASAAFPEVSVASMADRLIGEATEQILLGPEQDAQDAPRQGSKPEAN